MLHYSATQWYDVVYLFGIYYENNCKKIENKFQNHQIMHKKEAPLPDKSVYFFYSNSC